MKYFLLISINLLFYFTLITLFHMEKHKQKTGMQEVWKWKDYSFIKTEKQLFHHIWKNRPHICELTWKPIKEAQARCFAHILWKWMHPKYRLDPNNIILVYWPDEHREIDRLASWKKFLLEQYLKLKTRLTVDLLKRL